MSDEIEQQQIKNLCLWVENKSTSKPDKTQGEVKNRINFFENFQNNKSKTKIPTPPIKGERSFLKEAEQLLR